MYAQRGVLLLVLPCLANVGHLPDITEEVDHLSSYLHKPVEEAEVHEEGVVVADEVRVVFAVVVVVVDDIEEVAVDLDVVVVAKRNLDQGFHRMEGLEVEYPVYCILRTPLDRCSLHSWKEERNPLGRSSLGSRAVPLVLPISLHLMLLRHPTP
jgi:hypothetical protein